MSNRSSSKKLGIGVAALAVLAFVFSPPLLGGAILLGLSGMMGMSASAACDNSVTQGNVVGTAPQIADLFQAVVQDSAGDNRLVAAMLVGSYLESGWNPSAISKDGAFGAFQIQHPGVVHPDITVAEALNAASATNFMLPAYKAALNTIDPSLWSTNPELAAESVAYAAERPRYSYYQSQGASKVRAAYVATLGKMIELGTSTTFSGNATLAGGPATNNPSAQVAAQNVDCYGYNSVSFAAYGPTVQTVLDAAESQLGIPYVYGGGTINGPSTSALAKGNFWQSGYDCSSYTQYAFNKADITLPRSARAQWLATQQYRVQPGQEQPGDLVFFGGYLGTASGPGHVGIVLDPSKKLMYTEPKTGDVSTIGTYDWGSDVMGFTRPYPTSTTTTLSNG